MSNMIAQSASKDGPEVAEPISLQTKWDYELFARPKAGADTDGSW